MSLVAPAAAVPVDAKAAERSPRRRLPAWLSMAAAIVLTKALLDYTYAFYVVPLFGYTGLGYDYSAVKHLESYVWLVILIALLPDRVRRPSDFLVVCLFLAAILPVLSFYGLNDASRPALLMMLASFAIVGFARRWRAPSLVWFSVHKVVVIGIASAAIMATMAAMLSVNGLRTFNLNPFLVYDFRLENNETFGGALAYPVAWVTRVFNPVLVLVAVWRRKYVVAAALVGVQIFLYGMTSHKAVAVYPFIVIGTYALLSGRRPLNRLCWMMPAGVLFAVALAEFSDYLVVVSWAVRRAFFVPAFLSFSYFEFFADSQKLFFSNSFLAGIVRYPYAEPYQRVMGAYAFTARPPPWANVGFLATGFMHLGIVGPILYGMLVGSLLKVADSLAASGPSLAFATAFVVVPFALLFTTADLPTTLLSHGLAVNLLFLWLWRSAALRAARLEAQQTLDPTVRDASEGALPEASGD